MVLEMLFLLVVADVLIGAADMAITWGLWRDHVSFKRRYSYSDPMPFHEFNARLHRRKR